MTIYDCFIDLFLDYGVPTEYAPICSCLFVLLLLVGVLYCFVTIIYSMRSYLVFKTANSFFVKVFFFHSFTLNHYIKCYNRKHKNDSEFILQVVQIPDLHYLPLIAYTDNVSYYKDCKLLYQR